MTEQLPPCCIEAEEAVLGALLLDPRSIVRTIKWLPSSAFFVRGHRIIYEAIVELHYDGKDSDLIGVSTYLHDRGALESIGGTAKLAMLLNRTVSATALEGHARLVDEKYQRRKLIAIAHSFLEIAEKRSESLAETYNRLRDLLPEEIMEASQFEYDLEITKINYTIKSPTGDRELKFEADVRDNDGLSNSVARLAAMAKICADDLWNEQC